MGTEVQGPRRHLDLGCGTRPRNPYGCEALYGVDIRDGLTAPGVQAIVAANLAVQPIPFPDNHFDSLSAYDFLEHIPRVTVDHSSKLTFFPFVNLMNEVWRVLKPDGKFYAVFPAFPHGLAFSDPTHVNIMTSKSHRYFTGLAPLGTMYGFKGRFELLRQNRLHPRGDLHPHKPGLKLTLKSGADLLMRRKSHLLWEFKALHPNTR
jgi:SAM-dependent methyltransferase